MTQVIHRAKWLVPLIVIVAMLAVVGIVWAQSGSSGGSNLGNLGDLTKTNPAYDDQIVTPSESVPFALWSVTMDPPTSTVPIGGGTLATVVLTNNIPAPLMNGAAVGRIEVKPNDMQSIKPASISNSGDLTGDLYVTSDIYNNLDPTGCLTVYNSLPLGAGDDGVKSETVTVKIFPDITVHPGLTVTFQVLVMPGQMAVPGAEYMLKAEFRNVKGLIDCTDTSDPLHPEGKLLTLNPFP